MAQKKDKRHNALKHGLYSHEVMLPGEKLEDYEALCEATYDELTPEGVTEQSLVDNLCVLNWKKRRMEQYDQICLQQRAAQFDQNNEYNRHRINLKNLGPEFSAAASIEAVEKILSRISSLYAEIIAACVPREKCEDLTQWGQEIGKYLSDLKPQETLEGANLFAAIVDPDLMEIQILRSNRIDDAIDRTLKRFWQLKTAKQIFPNIRKNAVPEVKLINPPPSADSRIPATDKSEPKRAGSAEILVSVAKDADKFATATAGIVIEQSCNEPGAAPVPQERKEKEHSNEIHAIGVNSTKPIPTMLEELTAFSPICDRLIKAEMIREASIQTPVRESPLSAAMKFRI
jgi:hypothetical protein